MSSRTSLASGPDKLQSFSFLNLGFGPHITVINHDAAEAAATAAAASAGSSKMSFSGGAPMHHGHHGHGYHAHHHHLPAPQGGQPQVQIHMHGLETKMYCLALFKPYASIL
jgi:hypothetical protein